MNWKSPIHATAFYCGALLGWWLIFVVVEGAESPVGLVAFGALNIGVGFAVGRWWVVLLATVVLLVGVPFADEPFEGETSGFEVIAAVAPIAAGLLAAGAAARWLVTEADKVRRGRGEQR